jgi:predicted DNA-binding transcriptional regulator AlpA
VETAKKDLTGNSVQGNGFTGLHNDVVSIEAVSRRLHVPKTTLYGWRYKGKGPQSRRVGKHLRYRWSEVLEWLDALD